MRIFIDMDGVIVDFDGYIRRHGLTVDQGKYTPGSFSAMHALPGAIDSVQSLIARGHDVWIATRPVENAAHTYSEKAQWIFTHLPQLANRVILTRDKGLLGGPDDLLIDDRPEKANCMNFPGTVIKFEGSWPKVLEQIENAPGDVRSMMRTSIAAKERSLGMAVHVEQAARAIGGALAEGRKVLICGNGGSASDSEHFAAELLGRYKRERPGLPCIALTKDSATVTAIANDYGYDEVFARQVGALGKAGDVLIAISTSGRSKNVIRAIQAAQLKRMTVISLTGGDGGDMALMDPSIDLRAASYVTARIQEVHGLMLHCICASLDNMVAQ